MLIYLIILGPFVLAYGLAVAVHLVTRKRMR